MGKHSLAPLAVLLSCFVTTAASVRTIAAPIEGNVQEPQALATFTAASGSMVLELDPTALLQAGLPMLQNADGSSSSGSFIFEVSAAGSELRVTLRDDQVLRISGYLQTRGVLRLPTARGALSADSRLGDFVVSLSRRGGWMTDQQNLYRNIFELDSAAITIHVDEATESMVITAPVVIAESFADEVLRNPSVARTVVGAVSIDVGVSLTDVDTPDLHAAETTNSDDVAAPRGGTLNGPDVIVHNIGSALTLYGTIGGVSAYAMTTVSCNLGEQDAIWIDCLSGPQCNQHPVIVQNMYRLKGGRFEQIGLAWLKHGWCAADAPSCGSPYEPNGSCDWLGTHATDTYGASLNADQQDLGPRSEVNAWTGVFPYPYVLNWNLTGNSIYKRLQIKVDDVNPSLNSGALYFGESQYVATDEQPINRYNNCTWRRVNVGSASGGGWNMSFTGSSITQQPAIYAWPANESGVTLVNVDVPGDGRLILGYKVSDLGGGMWHYEYALYNMNSHRSVGAFTVPAAASLSIANIGFHDVDYHSGEPYSLTDWPGVHAGGAVSWQTEKFTTNPNANALRWSTLYNYRFDANTPPTMGTIELGLFRTGSPDSVLVAAAIPSVPVCDCGGDLDGSGAPDGLDIQPFVAMYVGSEPVDVCADLATPNGGALTGDDVTAFVETVLSGECAK